MLMVTGKLTSEVTAESSAPCLSTRWIHIINGNVF